jgi:uncharacterized protein
VESGLVIFLLANSVVALGAVLQASTGLGAGLMVVPLLALIDIRFIPGPVIFGSLVLTAMMTLQGRAHIHTVHLGKVLLGLIIGLAAGVYSLSVFPADRLGVFFGILILLAVAISYAGFSLRLTPVTMFSTGLLSGYMGGSSAIGAPVLALAYQHQPGPSLRATLALLYFLFSIMALVLLYFIGRFALIEITYGTALIPGFVIGYFLAGGLARRLDRGQTRMAVLALATFSALIPIVRNI